MSWPLAFAVVRTSSRSPGQASWTGSAAVGRSAALVRGSRAARAMPGRRFTAGSDGESLALRASMCGRRRWASTWCSSGSVRADRQRTAPRRVLLHVGGGGRERRAVLPGEVWTPRPEVRGGLTRAVRAAERVRRVAEAPAGGTDENPSAAGAGGREQPRGGRRRRREGTT